MSSSPVKADPALFSDCGDAPCPQPVANAVSPEIAHGVRMRDNPAEWTFVRLSKLIEDFEAGLDKDEEIAATLVGLPGTGTLQIEDVGFWGPDLILFFGKNPDGKRVRLVQHYTQTNVLLDAKKKPEDRAARRIGFQLSELVEKTQPKA